MPAHAKGNWQHSARDGTRMVAELPPPTAQAAVRVQLVCSDDDTVHLQLSTVEERVELHLDIHDEAVSASMHIREVATPLDAGASSTTAPSGLDVPCEAEQEAEGAAAGQACQDAADAGLHQRHAELLRENQRLQGLVRQYLDGISKASRKSLQEASAATGEGADQQARYMLALQQLRRLVGQREAADAAACAALAPEQARAAAASAAAAAQRAALLQLVGKAAAAANGATAAGQPRAAVPDQLLRHFQAAEPAKAAACAALRAATARLAHRLAAAERRLKEADQLSADGLHLVDFEQMRIETAALAAKRETRAAEVEKLRGKLVQTVQITAHIREKLHCAKQERGALAAALAAAEAALGAARAEQTAAKADRERLRRERGELAEDWRVVADRRCLDDMQAQVARLEALQAQAAELQARFEAGEQARVQRHRRRLAGTA